MFDRLYMIFVLYTVSIGFLGLLAFGAKAADEEFDDFMSSTLIRVCIPAY